MESSNIIVVMALPSESQGLFEEHNVPVLFTGVGKVNATYQLTKTILQHKAEGKKIDLVLNLGTAGSRTFPTASVVYCQKFAQRDMDVSLLGFKHGETPYEDSHPIVLEHKDRKQEEGVLYGTCGTGDSFSAEAPKIECDVIDMEGYALAKVCLWENVPFLAVKYITDGADDNAAKDWIAALKDGSKKLFEVYKVLSASDKPTENIEKKIGEAISH